MTSDGNRLRHYRPEWETPIVLFVSYSRDDRIAVERLAADLTRFGREVWLDERLEGGADWWEEIVERIRSCTAFLFVISEGSASSRPCRIELTYALALDRGVLPVALRDDLEDTLPAELTGLQVVSYREGSKDEVADLLRALSSLDGERPLPDPLPAPPELPASQYGQLRDQVRADRLDGDQQEAVLRRIRELWAEEGDTDRALLLVEGMRDRSDLLASVVPEVEALTTELAAADASTPGHRRALARWGRLGRAGRVGIGLGSLSLVAVTIGLLSSDLYVACEGCGTRDWGDSSGVSRWPYLVLAVVVLAGLIATVVGRANRAGGIAVLGAGAAILATVWRDITHLTEDGNDAIYRFGSGLWWTMLAGLLVVVAGTVLVVAESGTTADDRHAPSR